MEASGLVPLFGDRANADLALNLDMSTLFLLFPWYLANLNDGGDRPLTAY